MTLEMIKDKRKKHLRARHDHYVGLAMMGFIIGEAKHPKGLKMFDVTQASFEMAKVMTQYEAEHNENIDNFIDSFNLEPKEGRSE